MSLAVLVRWIHILAIGAWIGEVLIINTVLVPAAAAMSLEDQRDYLADIFPRVFRVASVLTLTVLISGFTHLYLLYGLQWGVLLTSSRGIALALGATLATLLIAFHFFLEPRAGDLIHGAKADPEAGLEKTVIRVLQFIPRVGLGIVITTAILMMYSARGL